MKRKNNRTKRSGAALVLAVIMVIILFLTGIGLIQLGRNARLQAVKDVLKISARSAADAGIEHAVRYMIDVWNGETDKDAWVYSTWYDATVWTDPAVPATAIGYPLPAPINLGGTFGDAEFQYNIYKGTRSDGYQIISTGTAAGATRIVHAAVVLRSVFFGIGAKKDIYIYPGMDLGTVPDGETFTIQTNNEPDDEKKPAIILKPGTYVPGDVIVGPGDDIDEEIDSAPNVTITGEAKAAEDDIPFPPVYPPNPSLPVGSWTVPDEVNEPNVAYISGDVELNGLTLGSGIDTLYIEGNPAVNGGEVNVFVDGFTYLPSGTQLIVAKDSSLVLYLGGNMDIKPGSMITYANISEVTNPTDEFIIEAASSISIKGTVAIDGTPLCTDIQFFPNGDFYGTIYAPDADPLYIAPGGDFYGAIVGAGNITLKPGGTFMFIPSLVDTNDVEVLYMGIKNGSWWEE